MILSLGPHLHHHIGNIIDSIHILPFWPWSSDDGFSVIDYRQVSSDFGKWKDVKALGQNFNLMFDIEESTGLMQQALFP